MIRPKSEIEYPPSEGLRMKAAMIARMEALHKSSNEFMAVIAARVSEEKDTAHQQEALRLSEEQDYLMENMQRFTKE